MRATQRVYNIYRSSYISLFSDLFVRYKVTDAIYVILIATFSIRCLRNVSRLGKRNKIDTMNVH